MTLPSHTAGSRHSLDLEAAVRLLGAWANDLEKRGEWRYVKSLLIVAGAEDWNTAAQLADALGVHPDDQQAIYRTVTREATP